MITVDHLTKRYGSGSLSSASSAWVTTWRGIRTPTVFFLGCCKIRGTCLVAGSAHDTGDLDDRAPLRAGRMDSEVPGHASLMSRS
jgi:hypothetical protein